MRELKHELTGGCSVSRPICSEGPPPLSKRAYSPFAWLYVRSFKPKMGTL